MDSLLSSSHARSTMVSFPVNDVNLQFELDTGSVHTIVYSDDWCHIGFARSSPALHSSSLALQGYSVQPLIVRGECVVRVQHDSRTLALPLVVIDNDGPPLIGLHWIRTLTLDLNRLVHAPPPANIEASSRLTIAHNIPVTVTDASSVNYVRSFIRGNPATTVRSTCPTPLSTETLKLVKRDDLPARSAAIVASSQSTSLRLRPPQYHPGHSVRSRNHRLKERARWLMTTIFGQFNSTSFELRSGSASPSVLSSSRSSVRHRKPPDRTSTSRRT